MGSIPGQEYPLEKDMAIHSSSLAWEIPWTEGLGGLQSMGVTKSWTRLCDYVLMRAHAITLKTLV